MHVVLCETVEKDDSDEQTQSPVYDKVSAWGTDMPFLHSKVRQSILRVITGSFPWLIWMSRAINPHLPRLVELPNEIGSSNKIAEYEWFPQ